MDDNGFHYVKTKEGDVSITCVCGEVYMGLGCSQLMEDHIEELVTRRPKVIVEIRGAHNFAVVNPPVTDRTVPGSISAGSGEERVIWRFGWEDGEGPHVRRLRGTDQLGVDVLHPNTPYLFRVDHTEVRLTYTPAP